MKRLLCVLLAVTLTFALCACSEGKSVMDKFTDTVNSLVSVAVDQQTTTPATKHEVALKRGNEVGNVCYNAQLPIITADGIQDKTVDPTSFGKVTVMTFWGTWCGPSVADMPDFDAVANKYGDQLAVVAVHGIMPQTASTFIAKNYANSPIVFVADTGANENEYSNQMGGGAYPYTVVINEKGIITHIFRQSITQEQLETAVLEAMGRM